MEKKTIEIVFFDNAYDVEVFNWIDEINCKGIRNNNLSDFGLKFKEVNDLVNKLTKKYDIVSIKKIAESDSEMNEVYGEVNQDFVWSLIERSLQINPKDQRDWLITQLSKMNEDTMEELDERLIEISRAVMNHGNFQNAHLLSGTHNFEMNSFCGWLLSKGKYIVDKVLDNPINVHQYIDSYPTNDFFLSMVVDARVARQRKNPNKQHVC